MKNCIFIIILLHCFFTAQSQVHRLQVSADKSLYARNDTVWLEANYTVNDQLPSTASLFLIMINDQGKIWNLRWPILNGNIKPAIVFGEEMPPGTYALHFAARNEFFRLKGKLVNPTGLKTLKASLLTPKGEALISEISLEKNGDFVYNNLLFENDAFLLFENPGKNKDAPDIEISTGLDSAFTPTAQVILEIAIEKKSPSLFKPVKIDSIFTQTSSLLPEVVFYTTFENKTEQLNKRYSSGLFNDMNARIIDVGSDPNANMNFSVIQYLRGRIAGLTINNRGAGFTATWRGDRVYFYVDEMRVDAFMADNIPMADIALIKAFPPPFFGNPMGGGGAIAIYTKKGDYNKDRPRNKFSIHGYSPLLVELPLASQP